MNAKVGAHCLPPWHPLVAAIAMLKIVAATEGAGDFATGQCTHPMPQHLPPATANQDALAGLPAPAVTTAANSLFGKMG